MQNPTENSIPSNPSNPIEISDNEDINFTYALNTIQSPRGINRAEFLIIADSMKNQEIDNISKLINSDLFKIMLQAEIDVEDNEEEENAE